jgi:hypothetical protein
LSVSEVAEHEDHEAVGEVVEPTGEGLTEVERERR